MIEPREAQLTIHKLRGRSAAGTDGVATLTLKHIRRKMLVLLTRLFNAILQHSHLPSQWKIAKVIMIPKATKDTLFPHNNRPISVLSVISKIFEHLLKIRLFQHIHSRNIFPSHQFGFRPKFNTVAQITVEEIILQFNRREHAIDIFLDTAKAFDKVWHQGLLYKLEQQEFPHQYIRLLQSYLSARSFFVSYKGTQSQQYPIIAGVPQGSVLAPLPHNL